MKSLTRFLLNAFIPPILASAIVASLESLALPATFLDLPYTVLAIAGYAYVFAALPCLIHASLMEIAYRKMAPTHPGAMALSGASGALAGVFISHVILPNTYGSTGTHSFVIVGATIGLLLGLIIATFDRRLTRKHASA